MEKRFSHPKAQKIYLILLLVVFTLLKWKSLHILPWSDEHSYLNHMMLNQKWSFFLPWNYHPEDFMGHPMLQFLILYIALNLFGQEVFIAKATALGFSLLCLFSLYKTTHFIFKDKFTSLFSVVFTMLIPLYWFHSTLILAHIPLMAFGFGTIYAFLSRKYKTLVLFSLCLATIRESALAFFLPLIMHGFFLPVQRKSLLYMLPSLLLFFSHFFIFFIRTGHWFAHPYTYKGLPHNPNPVFFNFSDAFERFVHFSRDFFYQFPYLIFGLLLLGLILFFYSNLRQKCIVNNILRKKRNRTYVLKIWSITTSNLQNLFKKSIFIPLFTCALFFIFYISYPDYTLRNFFPVLLIFVPFCLYFIKKTVPFSPFVLIIIGLALFLQNIFQNEKISIAHTIGIGVKTPGSDLDKHQKQKTSLAKSFVTYLEKTYGDKTRSMEKWIYMPYPYDQTMKGPLYGYVKKFYNIDHHRFLEKPERYSVVALIRKEIPNLPYNNLVYQYIKDNDSFVESPSPFSKKIVLFIHKDMLLDQLR